MTPVQAVISVLRNAYNFSGRSTRPEFWWFVLAAFVVYVIAGSIPGASWIVNPVLALFILAVGVRRLHDTGRSGWWIIPLYIPLVAAPTAVILTLWTRVFLVDFFSVFILIAVIAMELTVLAMLALPGTRSPNKYGPDPLQPVVESMRERADAPLELTSLKGNHWTGNRFIFAAAVFVAVIGTLLILFSLRDDGDQADLTTILAMAENGQITSITVDGDRLIAVQRQNNQRFIAAMEPDTNIFEVLQLAGINPVERGIDIEVQRSRGLEYQFGILVQFLPLIFFGAMLLAGVSIVLLLLISRRR